ncbi:Autophagy-related protein 18a [Balamuthia mandrillaris]
MNLAAEQRNPLLFMGFNQDHGCFACGTDNGFQIWNCDPVKERFRREFDGGIGVVEMLFRCNILALVGGGKNPKYPPNKVMIWDDYQNKCLAELEFRSEVKGVRLRRDRIVVALENKVYVYNFSDLQLLHQIETTSNPRGLMALSPDPNKTVLACPGLKPGYVHVRLNDINKSTPIKAHDNALSYIALNLDGTRLATASEQGTLIRVWDTVTGEQLAQLRRGKDRAEINCISFSNDSSWLCVSSDKGTVHVFGLGSNRNKGSSSSSAAEDTKTRKSSLYFMKDFIPSSLGNYIGDDFSFAQVHLTIPRSICAFGQDNHTLVVIGADGAYYKYSFDPELGGEGKLEQHVLFLKQDEEDEED